MSRRGALDSWRAVSWKSYRAFKTAECALTLSVLAVGPVFSPVTIIAFVLCVTLTIPVPS